MSYDAPGNRMVTRLIAEEIMREREGGVSLKTEGEWQYFIFTAIGRAFEPKDVRGCANQFAQELNRAARHA